MKIGVFTYNDDSYNFEFKTSLSAYEKMVFVKTVVGSIVDENGYDSILRDLIFDFAIIEAFTNVDTSFIDAKDDDGNDIPSIITIEHFLDNSNVVDVVKANMEIGLLDELNRAVDLDIQYRTGIKTSPLSDALAHLVRSIDEKVNNLDLEEIVDMVKNFANMSEDFTMENAMNAFMNSDFHKKNLEEIAKAKAKAEKEE